ncbi:MAG: carboxypeptidase regulatory-like domain-containing protein [Candidatus Cloacimonetes bacterium]|nr:carboxypeptidase regulatory-like domain-containing protein [Candidatus Cloacimonadota bacterium]
MNIKKIAFLTFILILFFIPIIIGANLFGDNILFPDGHNINAGILTSPLNRNNDITLTDIPMDLYKTDESFTISWTPSDSCTFYYSPAPGGTDINNYTSSGSNGTGTGSIEICADDIGIGVGVYYCVIHNETEEWTSIEFQLMIESSNGVSMNTPASGAAIDDPTPIFSWDPNPGVPYYLLVLSDNPFTLEYDEEDNLVVSGLNPVWAIITPENSVVYGTQDPSGSFFYSAPPLVPGIEYNWIVMNNYGNNPLLTSDVASTPFGFTFETLNPIGTPELISPENTTPGDTTIFYGDDYITFEWTVVEEAMTYHIFLSEIRIEEGSEVQYPVWDQVTTNNLIDFNASAILIDARYVWKVIASDEDGISACSDVFEFRYHIPIGTFKIWVHNPDGIGIGFANVVIDPVEGSGDNIPLAVGASGYEYKILPVGTYVITASKDGYETNDTLVTLYEDPYPDPDNHDGDISVPIELEYSLCFFYSSVVGTNGLLIANCAITAEKDDGEIRTTTTRSGNYNIAVIPGMWTISADKKGYSLQSTIESYIGLNQNINLDNLVLILNEKNVKGYVKNTSDIPLSCVTVTATKDDITQTKSTSSNGLYQFIGLELGEWSVYAQKDGYYSPDPTIVQITSAS